jgi:hypothetical protein
LVIALVVAVAMAAAFATTAQAFYVDCIFTWPFC